MPIIIGKSYDANSLKGVYKTTDIRDMRKSGVLPAPRPPALSAGVALNLAAVAKANSITDNGTTSGNPAFIAAVAPIHRTVAIALRSDGATHSDGLPIAICNSDGKFIAYLLLTDYIAKRCFALCFTPDEKFLVVYTSESMQLLPVINGIPTLTGKSTPLAVPYTNSGANNPSYMNINADNSLIDGPFLGFVFKNGSGNYVAVDPHSYSGWPTGGSGDSDFGNSNQYGSVVAPDKSLVAAFGNNGGPTKAQLITGVPTSATAMNTGVRGQVLPRFEGNDLYYRFACWSPDSTRLFLFFPSGITIYSKSGTTLTYLKTITYVNAGSSLVFAQCIAEALLIATPTDGFVRHYKWTDDTYSLIRALTLPTSFKPVTYELDGYGTFVLQDNTGKVNVITGNYPDVLR